MSTTFHALDEEAGIIWQRSDVVPDNFFDDWYLRVRDTRLDELTVEDLCIACQQRIHLAGVVPYAICVLRNDLAAGERFDGELVDALADLEPTFWETFPALAESLRLTVQGQIGRVSEEVRQFAVRVLANTRTAK
jgi:hypothetical protein